MIRGHEELFFEFTQAGLRDDCAVTLLRILEPLRYLHDSILIDEHEVLNARTAKQEHQLLQEARKDGEGQNELRLPTTTGEGKSLLPFPYSRHVINFLCFA